MNYSSQRSGFQLGDTGLVSTPANSPYPTAPTQHAEAIGVLKNEDDKDIFAWLTLARSLGRKLQYPYGHAYLTRDQVRAIAALRHCNSNDISAWLHLARTSGASGISAVSASYHVHNWTPDQGHTPLSISDDAGGPDALDLSSNHGPVKQADTQGSLKQLLPTETIPTPQARPRYCCTLCSYFRPFKNQSDWKKHEKEHDTTYICMLEGPREATAQGTQCAFCGLPNPHDVHFLEHNAQACRQGPPDSFASKRRHELVNHMSKIHGIHVKSLGEAIAVKWKLTVEKQAWSCGFCVTTFGTFNDRLIHIATQHFERGQTIEEWDAIKVILGLLQQSGMAKSWHEKMASLPSWEVDDLIWERDAIIGLQHDLEVGPNDDKSAEDLAEAAYAACRFKRGMETQRAIPVTDSKSDGAMVATSLLSNQLQASLASTPNFEYDDLQSLLASRDSNKVSTNGPAISRMNHYSSASVANLNDDNNTSLAGSSLDLEQPHQFTTLWGNDNDQNGDTGNDMEEDEDWTATLGSVHETDFDTMFQ